MQNKIKTHGGKAFTNFPNLNIPEVCIEWESFTTITIDSLLIYDNKYYL